MPKYLRVLSEYEQVNDDRISSSELGRRLGYTASQVRQDLNSFGGFGQQGYGYCVSDLKAEIDTILGKEKHFSAIVIGVGNIGRALIENSFFEENGFNIVAAFDVSPDYVGKEIDGVKIYDIATLNYIFAVKRVDVAALCVPYSAAKDVSERLVDMGIKAIWNFTNAEVCVHQPAVIVENVHFSDSLLTLSYRLGERQHSDMPQKQTSA